MSSLARPSVFQRGVILVALAMGAACASAPTATPSSAVTQAAGDAAAYPAPATAGPADAGYPGPTLAGSAAQGTTPVPPAEAPAPAEGFAAVSGMLYSYVGQRVIPGTQFYLTPALGEDKRSVPMMITGPEDGLGNIVSMTDEQGSFALDRVPPGNYYLVIWAPLNWVLAETSQQDQTPRLIELAEGQSLPLGLVVASWP